MPLAGNRIVSPTKVNLKYPLSAVPGSAPVVIVNFLKDWPVVSGSSPFGHIPNEDGNELHTQKKRKKVEKPNNNNITVFSFAK